MTRSENRKKSPQIHKILQKSPSKIQNDAKPNKLFSRCILYDNPLFYMASAVIALLLFVVDSQYDINFLLHEVTNYLFGGISNFNTRNSSKYSLAFFGTSFAISVILAIKM
jgi:hypothetical protein